MLSPEERLKRAAISFGAWRDRANKSGKMPDRIKFVHAENALGLAAQKFFENTVKEQKRDPRRRSKG